MARESYSRDLEVMLGDPKRAVLVMTLPLILSYAVAQINMFADTAWCAGLGSYSSTALSSIIPYYWIISGIGTAIGIGAAATIARHLGRGESGEAESLVAQTLALSVIVGILITVPLYLSLGPLMDVMSLGEVSDHCREYIEPVIFSSTVYVLNGAVAGLLRAEGAAKKSMAVLILAAVMNMLLDPVLIYGAGLGLTGAGIAT
ncbi:MAG: MATE family efflux transporter, partial [Candidatus Methanomethylophilaceae archaeon]|nr:MATE family efflux transporter [Candidatus Methanomethylophilaceae archaeon]